MEKYYIIATLLFLIVIFIYWCFLINRKIKTNSYKIKEAEKKIFSLLKEKFETISKLKEKLEKLNITLINDDIYKLTPDDMEINILDNELTKFDIGIIETFEYNVNTKFDDEDLFLFNKYKNINIDMNGIKRYYNKYVEVNNKILKHFPAKTIGKFSKIKKKDKFEIKKEEILQLLKE